MLSLGISQNYQESYLPAAKAFGVLYALTFVPCWLAVFKIITSVRKKKLRNAVVWTVLLFFLLILPYLVAAVMTKELPWQIISLFFLIPLFGFFRVVENLDKASKTFWNTYAFFYDGLKYFSPYKRLISQICTIIDNLPNQKKILDFGTGTGNLIEAISRQHQDREIYGFDTSSAMINRAKRKVVSPKNITRFYCGEKISETTIPKDLDVIVLNNVLYTLHNPKETLLELKDYLKDRGIIVISDPKNDSSILELTKQYFISFNTNPKDFFVFLFYAPFIWILNVIIVSSESIHRFRTETQFRELLKSSGFEVQSFTAVYGNQNCLVIAKPT